MFAKNAAITFKLITGSFPKTAPAIFSGQPLLEDKNPGRLLLLRVRSSRAAFRSRPLHRRDGPGHDRCHRQRGRSHGRPAQHAGGHPLRARAVRRPRAQEVAVRCLEQ